ncbi:MAG: type I-E CRISPR-associated protein Cas5/CasD [Bacteroidetes bacterium]|jgi:CRISPR system Cascade subunit CasD|nr:type I-E CRISPR-associated protein Cas5/CasD [Bacteroidota bacterium]
MDILLLRFDAPLMSFGAPIVDNRGVIQSFPALSMVTGLLGNALGYDHADNDALEALQRRIRYAVRQDRRGRRLRDYQTVDLSKPYMDDSRAWTTRGALETRKGGSASTGTHIRERDYWADAGYTIACTLDPLDATPTLDDLVAALHHPARPLFIGRKACLPATPLYAGRRTAASLKEALHAAPLPDWADDRPDYRAWWPSDPEDERGRPVTDRRDWVNQIHVGQRWIAEGTVAPSEPANPASPSS